MKTDLDTLLSALYVFLSDHVIGRRKIGRPPSKVETVGRLAVDERAEDRALVVAQVRRVWWDGPNAMAGTAHPWRWETRRDAGEWRVWSAELPPWCGTHVRAELCTQERPQ